MSVIEGKADKPFRPSHFRSWLSCEPMPLAEGSPFPIFDCKPFYKKLSSCRVAASDILAYSSAIRLNNPQAFACFSIRLLTRTLDYRGDILSALPNAGMIASASAGSLRCYLTALRLQRLTMKLQHVTPCLVPRAKYVAVLCF
jgi:hypothetical protein